MRAVIQRVRRASVSVDGREAAAIGTGLLVLVGFAAGESELLESHRPSFHTSAPPEAARTLFLAFVREVAVRHQPVSHGVFQADMLVSLDNDGPVTVILEDRPTNEADSNA
ncbi:MAG TPA: D-aminoacyl-tRNA deacylase [bacterium]